MESELSETWIKRDLRDVESLMTMLIWCAMAVKKANSMLGISRKESENKMASIAVPTVENCGAALFVTLYIVLVTIYEKILQSWKKYKRR